MEENKIYCSHCGTLIEDDDYEEVNGEIVCTDCYERHTTTCDRCGEVIWTDDSYGDEYTTLCRHCYENHYTRCSCCDALLHEDDAYHLEGYDYCSECYHDEVDKSRSIHDYGYKPEHIFYGDSKRYFGVELEIDQAGKDSDNADELLAIANRDNEHIIVVLATYYRILMAFINCAPEKNLTDNISQISGTELFNGEYFIQSFEHIICRNRCRRVEQLNACIAREVPCLVISAAI